MRLIRNIAVTSQENLWGTEVIRHHQIKPLNIHSRAAGDFGTHRQGVVAERSSCGIHFAPPWHSTLGMGKPNGTGVPQEAGIGS